MKPATFLGLVILCCFAMLGLQACQLLNSLFGAASGPAVAQHTNDPATQAAAFNVDASIWAWLGSFFGIGPLPTPSTAPAAQMALGAVTTDQLHRQARRRARSRDAHASAVAAKVLEYAQGAATPQKPA